MRAGMVSNQAVSKKSRVLHQYMLSQQQSNRQGSMHRNPQYAARKIQKRTAPASPINDFDWLIILRIGYQKKMDAFRISYIMSGGEHDSLYLYLQLCNLAGFIPFVSTLPFACKCGMLMAETG